MKNKIFYYIVTFLTFLTFKNISAASQPEENDVQASALLVKVYNSEGKMIHSIEEGNLDIISPPNCTVYIPGALMAIEAGIISEDGPVIAYDPSRHQAGREVLKQPHNPENWVKNSCVWYASEIFHQIGKDKAEEGFKKLNYGNADLSSWKEPLPQFWIAGSLKITPREKSQFLSKLACYDLPFKKSTMDQVLKLTYIENIGDWKFHGKTGAQNMLGSDGQPDPELKSGWFDGIFRNEKTGTTITAVRYLEMKIKGEGYPSPIARDEVKKKLQELVALNKEW